MAGADVGGNGGAGGVPGAGDDVGPARRDVGPAGAGVVLELELEPAGELGPAEAGGIAYGSPEGAPPDGSAGLTAALPSVAVPGLSCSHNVPPAAENPPNMTLRDTNATRRRAPMGDTAVERITKRLRPLPPKGAVPLSINPVG